MPQTADAARLGCPLPHSQLTLRLRFCEPSMERAKRVIILGAGPAGLTAGYELARRVSPFVCADRTGLGAIRRGANLARQR